MKLNKARLGVIVAAAWLSVGSALAQTVDVWPGVAPGSENWKYVEKRIESSPTGPMVVNVVKPTLTAFLPKKGKATGAGVIVAPGGAFIGLAIDQEGNDVARWLAEHGVAAFVLKYRLMEQRANGGFPSMQEMDEAGKYAAADGIQALKVVRERAKEWGVDPARVGVIGFSAGATVTTATLFNADAAARPAFAGLIYGGPFGGPAAGTVPKQLPPVFLAWAQNDQIGTGTTAKMFEALTAAGHKPEAHAYTSGGHSFGAKKQGLSSDHWIDSFYWWLEAQGFTKKAAR
ncbi:MAG TPA: alpha/beta hydrolase [Erythrobacter sp.]|nr:alpha/beta hydrolase [Erythrobacter sp.]